VTFQKQGTFTFLHANQVDDPTWSTATAKANFDTQGTELKATLNALIDALEATTTSDSGAANIGSETITGLSGTVIRDQLVDLLAKLQAITDGSSGADLVGATAISGWTGTNVQALLESAKSYIDTIVLGTANIADSAITTFKIADNAVTTSRLQTAAVTSVKIGTNAITEDKIATDAVGSDKIQNGSVGSLELADNSVTNAKLRDSTGLSVIGRGTDTTGDAADIVALGDGQVLRRSGTALDFGQIGTVAVSDLAITAAKIANLAITAAKIADGTITGSKVASGTITGGNLANGTVTTTQIAAGTLDGRYFTEGEMGSAVANNSGSRLVGSETISGVNGNTVYTQLLDMKSQLDNVATGGLPDGSIQKAKLEVSIQNTLTEVENASVAATGNTLVERDSGARIKAGAPVAPSDVARKAETDALTARLDEAATVPATIKHGLNVVTTSQASGAELAVGGRTLVNVTGKDGNCESLTPFTTSGTVTLSTTQKKSGSNSIKFTSSGVNSFAYKDYAYPLDATKRHVAGVWVHIESYTSGGVEMRVGDIGTGTYRYFATAATSTVGGWQFVYVKIPTSNTLVGTGFRVLFGTVNTATAVAYFDDIRIYELSQADYDAIGTTYTATTSPSIDDFIPYVDSVQHLQGTAVRKYGKNMLPPFTQWTLHANAVVTEPYKLTLNATAVSQRSSIAINVIAGGQYTLSQQSAVNSQVYVMVRDTTSTGTVLGSTISATSVSFTAPTSGVLWVTTHNDITSGALIYDHPQLELGSAATDFTERNDDYAYIPTVLASNVDRSVVDTYNSALGTVTRRWKTGFVLDGSLSLASVIDDNGYRILKVDFSGHKAGLISAVKYNGVVLKSVDTGVTLVGTGGDYIRLDATALWITVLDVDSGWNESLNPNTNARKALMNGWKANANNGSVHTSWVSVLDGSAPATNTEAYVSANKAPNWTGWATLDYQLAVSVEETLSGDVGAIALHNGGNQVELLEGVIVREKANPVANTDGTTAINRNLSPTTGSILENRALKIIAVYRDNELDAKWKIIDTSAAYGNQIAYIQTSDFDATADYFVTYVVLDKYLYTSNAIDATLTYQSTLGSAVSKATQDIADIKTVNGVQDFAIDYTEAKVDNLRIDLDAHEADTSVTIHGSTSAATANALIHRDGSGRAKVAAPSASDDIARKDTVDDATTAANILTKLLTVDGINSELDADTVRGKVIDTDPTASTIVERDGSAGINVGLVSITPPGELGSTSGSLLDLSKQIGNVGDNTVGLVTRLHRPSTGSDWTTANVELIRVTDVTVQHSIIFDGDGNIILNIDGSKNINIPNGGLNVDNGSLLLRGEEIPGLRLNGGVAEYWNGGAWVKLIAAPGGTMTGALNVPLIESDDITTGNKQVINPTASQIFFGNPDTEMQLESSLNPTVNVGGTTHTLFHSGFAPFQRGTYTGNGAASRDITLPFTPTAALVMAKNGTTGGTQPWGGLALTGSPVQQGAGIAAVTIGTNKFTVTYGTNGNDGITNTNGVVYHYIAFR
jgi:hypothetical protein